jgi:energy-coupling factor transporter ATP-binding protein EcfA2
MKETVSHSDETKKDQWELPLFSGRPSLKFLAKDVRLDAYSVTQEFEYRETFDYYKNRLPIGIDEFGEPVYLNLSKVRHMLVLGGTGSGKSVLIRALFNRWYNAGGDVAILTDIKPEYWTSRYPVQPQFRKFLLPHERPTGYPIVSYKPYFLSKLMGVQKRADMKLCQFSIRDLTIYDFYTLLDISQLTDAKRAGIESSFNKVINGEIHSLKELRAEIEEMELSPNIIKSLTAIIKNIEDQGVIGDQFTDIDFVKDIRERRIPCLDLAGFERTGRFGNYAAAYVGLVTRQILTAKKQNKLPRDRHLMLVVDEAPRFIPNDGNPVSKEELLNGLDLFRSERGTMVFGAQDYRRVPETVMEQCKLIFVSYDTMLKSVKEIIKEKASYEYNYPITYGVELAQRIGNMRVHGDGSRDWLVIDVDRKDNYIMRPLFPLSMHKLEGM